MHKMVHIRQSNKERERKREIERGTEPLYNMCRYACPCVSPNNVVASCQAALTVSHTEAARKKGEPEKEDEKDTESAIIHTHKQTG